MCYTYLYRVYLKFQHVYFTDIIQLSLEIVVIPSSKSSGAAVMTIDNTEVVYNIIHRAGLAQTAGYLYQTSLASFNFSVTPPYQSGFFFLSFCKTTYICKLIGFTFQIVLLSWLYFSSLALILICKIILNLVCNKIMLVLNNLSQEDVSSSHHCRDNCFYVCRLSILKLLTFSFHKITQKWNKIIKQLSQKLFGTNLPIFLRGARVCHTLHFHLISRLYVLANARKMKAIFT